MIVATAAEFYVGNLSHGELTRDAIGDHIDALLNDDREFRRLREPLARVADARQRDDWHMAGEMLAQLAEKYPEDRRVACRLIENLIHEGRWSEASARTDALAVTDSLNLRVRHYRARCLMRSNRFDEAAALLEECQLVNPNSPDRLVDLGRALLHAAKYDAARRRFDAALKLDPKPAGALSPARANARSSPAMSTMTPSRTTLSK